jgi:hypothetical protein
VKGKLPAVPQQAQAEVDRNLQLLDRQTKANQRLVDTRGQGGPNFVQNAILGPLADKRKAIIDRITIAIGRTASRPTGLDALAACNLGLDTPGTQTSGAGAANQSPGGAQGAGGKTGQQGNGSGAAGRSNDGPTAADFVDITKVAPNVRKVRRQAGASTGAFTSRCGVNKQGQHNSDNDIVAPGVSNGAHHVHDYVGNRKVDFTSANESLSTQGTSCTNGDQSAYYWPVLRDITRQGPDAHALGGGAEGKRPTQRIFRDYVHAHPEDATRYTQPKQRSAPPVRNRPANLPARAAATTQTGSTRRPPFGIGRGSAVSYAHAGHGPTLISADRRS